MALFVNDKIPPLLFIIPKLPVENDDICEDWLDYFNIRVFIVFVPILLFCNKI